MKTKSWSYSYSYSNDGNTEKKEVHNEHYNGDDIYRKGFSVNNEIRGNNKDEKFYKYRKKDNKEKKMYGKSKNNGEWEIMDEEDNIKRISNRSINEIYNYKDAGSFRHRLEDVINNNEMVKVDNEINGMGNMFSMMGMDNNIIMNNFNNKNFNSIFDDDFFKN